VVFQKSDFSLAAFQDPIWSNNIHEWKPVWQDGLSGLYPELTRFLLLFAVLFIARLIFRRNPPKETESKPKL
jgi:hypothetical protein